MKKSILSVFLVLIISGFVIVAQADNHEGETKTVDISKIPMVLLLYGPYGQIVNYNGKNLIHGENKVTLDLNEQFYPLFKKSKAERRYYTRIKRNDYCGEGGGEYKLEIINFYQRDNRPRQLLNKEFEIDKPMFYCLTASDLLDKVKIPQTWENDTINIYCSDMGRSAQIIRESDGIAKDAISSFLFQKLEEGQVGCLVKNENVENGSLFYGFPYGNTQLQKETKPFYNETASDVFPLFNEYNLTSSLLIGDRNSMMELRRKNLPSDKIYLSYLNNSYDPYFIVSKDSEAIDYSLKITNILGNNIKDETSRTLMIRKFENKTIYGYQSQESMVNNYGLSRLNKSHDPIYVINFDGFGDTKQSCLKSLALYEPNGNFLNKDFTTVVCFPSDIVLQASTLNDRPFFEESYEDLAFTLFKNIITQADGSGENIPSPATSMGNQLTRKYFTS